MANTNDEEDRPTWRPTFIGDWIKFVGMTQTKVSELTGISSSHLSLVINGKRQYTQDILESVARVLNIDVERLFHPPTNAPGWLNLQGLTEVERLAAHNVVMGFKTKR